MSELREVLCRDAIRRLDESGAILNALSRLARNPTQVLEDLVLVGSTGLRILQEQEAQRVSDEKLVDDAFFEAVGFTQPILGAWTIESEFHRVRVVQGTIELQKKFQGTHERFVVCGKVETTKRGMLLKLLDSLLIPHK